jgi:hypothetical protein
LVVFSCYAPDMKRDLSLILNTVQSNLNSETTNFVMGDFNDSMDSLGSTQEENHPKRNQGNFTKLSTFTNCNNLRYLEPPNETFSQKRLDKTYSSSIDWILFSEDVENNVQNIQTIQVEDWFTDHRLVMLTICTERDKPERVCLQPKIFETKKARKELHWEVRNFLKNNKDSDPILQLAKVQEIAKDFAIKEQRTISARNRKTFTKLTKAVENAKTLEDSSLARKKLKMFSRKHFEI